MSALPPKADVRRLIRSPSQDTYCRSGSDPHSTLNDPSGRVSGSRRPPPGRAWGRRTYVRGCVIPKDRHEPLDAINAILKRNHTSVGAYERARLLTCLLGIPQLYGE